MIEAKLNLYTAQRAWKDKTQWTLTLCLENNFGEKRKERGREEKWNESNSCLFGREAKVEKRRWELPPNLSNFDEIETLTKIIHCIPPNPFLPFCYLNKGFFIPPNLSPFFPFLFSYPNNLTLCLGNDNYKEKRKEGKEKGGRETLVCLGEKGRERNRDESFPSKSFYLKKDYTLNKTFCVFL